MIQQSDSENRLQMVIFERGDLKRDLPRRHVEDITLEDFRETFDPPVFWLMTHANMIVYCDESGHAKMLKNRTASMSLMPHMARLRNAAVLERLLDNEENFPILLGMDKELDTIIQSKLKGETDG